MRGDGGKRPVSTGTFGTKIKPTPSGEPHDIRIAQSGRDRECGYEIKDAPGCAVKLSQLSPTAS